MQKVYESVFGTDNPFVFDTSEAFPEWKTMADAARAQDVLVELPCTLFEFYNGAIKKCNYERKVLIDPSQGNTKPVAESLKIEVLPGYSEKTRLVFSGRGHESFGAHTSNLIVTFV